MTDVPALVATRQWLSEFVIGLNLCPFAVAPTAADRVRFVVCEATRLEDPAPEPERRSRI